MNTLTILTLVPKADDRLARCLESAQWADDLFCVIDSRAEGDGSEEIVRRYTDHVAIHEYVTPTQQGEWAGRQIKTEWTLVLDADEWLSEPLIKRVQSIIKDPNAKDAYKIRRLSYFFGKLIRHCGWQRDYNVRLFRTAKAGLQDRRVHSRVVIDGSMGRIDEPIYHETFRNFEEYFATIQRYTTWGARDLYDKGRRAHVPAMFLHPLGRFLKSYVLYQGFRDGRHGLVLCGLDSFSSFTKYAKLWNLERLAKLESDGTQREENVPE